MFPEHSLICKKTIGFFTSGNLSIGGGARLEFFGETCFSKFAENDYLFCAQVLVKHCLVIYIICVIL